MTTTRQRRIAAGLCVNCTQPAPSVGRRCERCRIRENTRARHREAQLLELKCCVSCGGDSAKGNSRCEKCQKKNAQKCRDWRLKNAPDA